MARKNRNNAARKARNKARNKAGKEARFGRSLELTDEQQARHERRASRRVFSFRAQGSKEPLLTFVFSGTPVPYDPENPSEGLEEKTATQQALWQSLPDQVH
ncbi:MAG: hypothetical protein ACI81R_002489 [Bradymonadia bacterium]|jgi:hypothetical protein